TRKKEFLTLTHGFQLKREKIGAEARMREAEACLLVAEMQATREHLTAIIDAQAKPTGILWIDGFNALLRPAKISSLSRQRASRAYCAESDLLLSMRVLRSDGAARVRLRSRNFP